MLQVLFCVFSLSHILSLSLKHSHTHSHTITHTLTHTLLLTLTHTLTLVQACMEEEKKVMIVQRYVMTHGVGYFCTDMNHFLSFGCNK